MKTLMLLVTPLLVFSALGAAGPGDSNKTAPTGDAPKSPKPVNDILYARPFTLAKGYRNTWSQERALVSTGVLVVLQVDRAFVARRDAAVPILYAGDTPVHRLNHGDQSGRVIGIVPGVADLAGAPIWFGAPGLPERVTAEMARDERARAEKSGIRPFKEEKLRIVTRPPATVADLDALLREHVAPLVLEYSPQEKELAETWQLPAAKAPEK